MDGVSNEIYALDMLEEVKVLEQVLFDCHI